MFERFQFENFTPTPELESYANHALYNVLALAPQDSAATALVERVGQFYSCRIEVASINGPFTISVSAFEPKLAVERGVQKLKEKIAIWQKLRLGLKKFLPLKGALEESNQGSIRAPLRRNITGGDLCV